MRVEDHALEAQFPNAALDLLRGGRRDPAALRRRDRHSGRDGAAIAAASSSLASRASALAVAASNTCTPGEVSDRICTSMPVSSMSREAPLAQVLQALDDGGGARARAAQVEAPEAREARVVECAALEQLAVHAEHVARREGFLGRDPKIAGCASARDRARRRIAGLAHRVHLPCFRPHHLTVAGGEFSPGVDTCFAINRVRLDRRSSLFSAAAGRYDEPVTEVTTMSASASPANTTPAAAATPHQPRRSAAADRWRMADGGGAAQPCR